MLTAALSWPEALVASVSIVMLGLVLCVATWQIFRTGQTAIKRDAGPRDEVASLRKELDELRDEVKTPPTGGRGSGPAGWRTKPSGA